MSPGFDLSVLSADGRWRLTKEASHWALFDLNSDHRGYESSLDRFPEQAVQMVRQFDNWSWEVLRLPVRTKVRGGAVWNDAVAYLRGGADRIDLSGFDLLRTPGKSGWSFAVGIAPAGRAEGRQIVARQEGVWSVTREDNGDLLVSLGGSTVRHKGPGPAKCAAFVLTALVLRLRLWPTGSYSGFSVYLDGRKVEERSVVLDPPPTDVWQADMARQRRGPRPWLRRPAPQPFSVHLPVVRAAGGAAVAAPVQAPTPAARSPHR